MATDDNTLGEVREAPGWDAIDRALAKIYGDQEPLHWGPLLPWTQGGDDPLDGISCYQAPGHWHFVTYGLSELYQKTSTLSEQSGWGFELTLRLNRAAGEAAPPHWPLSFLQTLGRYVFNTKHTFGVGDQLDLVDALAGKDTELCAALFALDPQLPDIVTPNGTVRFIQIVGVTADELEAVCEWNCESLLEVMAAKDQWLMTDLGRESIRDDPEVERAIQEGTRRDGSSRSESFAEVVRWESPDQEQLKITVSVTALPELARALKGRVAFGRTFELTGPEQSVILKAGEKADWSIRHNAVVIAIPTAAARAICEGLVRGERRFQELPFLTIEAIEPGKPIG